jgi:hypothetical protein
MSAVIHLYETAHSGYYDDDPTRKINLVPKTWTKFTVTDGDWKTKYTINPLSARDEYIADCIEDLDSKVKIIVPGNNTTITTDNLGNEYINQHFQPSPDTIKIRSSQNTVTASVVTDEITKHTTVSLGLNPGTYNLETLNWKFNTNLSANSFSSVGLTSTNANIATITGLTNVTATTFNPVTNLTAINLYNPNEFKIYTNLSAVDLSAKDYIANDSFKIDGTAHFNEISTKPSIVQETAKAEHLEMNTTQYLPQTLTLTNATATYRTNTNNLVATSFENRYSLNTTSISGETFKINNNVFTPSISAKTDAVLTNVSATRFSATHSSGTNYAYVNNLKTDEFTVDADFDVLTASNRKTSLSAILNRALFRPDLVEGRATIEYNVESKSWASYTKDSHESGTIADYAGFKTTMKNLYKSGVINNFIFRLNTLAEDYFYIPIYLEELKPFVIYSFYIANFGPLYDDANHTISLCFQTTNSTTKHFYNCPKFHFALNLEKNTTYLPWVDSTSTSDPYWTPQMEIQVPGGFSYTDQPSDYDWWEHMEMTSLRSIVGKSAICNCEVAGERDAMSNLKGWTTIMRNIKFTIEHSGDDYLIYFLNGNNY